MDAVESMAIEPPLCAKVLALDTLVREQALDTDFWKDLQWQMPKVYHDCLVRLRYILLIHVDEQSRLVCPARLRGVQTRRQGLCRIYPRGDGEDIRSGLYEEDYMVKLIKRDVQ
jgi:hypothetical protein